MTKIITRFAPSPTGFLHTGSARTALFNFLFSRANNGEFVLRIEDTDKERSNQEITKNILSDLKWLGLNWDGEVVYQGTREERHKEVALQLLESGNAYKCYSSQQEIEEFRARNLHQKFQSPWRDKKPDSTISDQDYVIRLKVKQSGQTVLNDQILGEISVNNEELDDMILLRSDGSPTYMLAVVVDDHDMDITHVIRGDDHLTNTFRQLQIYHAFNWTAPEFAHLPLILDKNGKKLSKRNDALGVFEYKKLGYLPEAVCNHLLRLGWSHGDEEIIEMEKATKLFDLKGIGKSPARFDQDKLDHINSHYLQSKSPEELLELTKPFNEELASPEIAERFLKSAHLFLERVNTLKELAESCNILIKKVDLDEQSKLVMQDFGAKLIRELADFLLMQDNWNKNQLKSACQDYAKEKEIKFSQIMQTLRAAVIGTFQSPGVFDIIEVLGKEELANRLKDFRREDSAEKLRHYHQ